MFERVTEAGRSDFRRNGNLKSNITFSWCGEIRSMSVRRFILQARDGEDIEREQWALDIEDCYQFKMSYFKRGATREGVELLAAKLPYGQTIIVQGEINVRRGNTFFNAKRFLYPDGSPIMFSAEEQPLEEGGISDERLAEGN